MILSVLLTANFEFFYNEYDWLDPFFVRGAFGIMFLNKFKNFEEGTLISVFYFIQCVTYFQCLGVRP